MAQSLGIAKDGVPRPKIQTLSDMIFGLALSIGAATELTQKPGSIVAVAYSIISFGFAFLILGLVWLRYSRIMSVLPVEGTGVVTANMILLFLVTLEPYIYNLMNASSFTPSPGQLDSATTTTLYALDVGALMIISAYFIHELTKEERKLIPKELLRGYKLTMYSTLIAASMLLLSTLPVFWSIIIIQSPAVPLRYIMWNGVWVANLSRRLGVRVTGQKGRQH